MNHLGDTNKMVDTPRMDRVLKNCNGWHHVPIEMARELERELNVASQRIKRLEAGDAALTYSIGLDLQKENDTLQQRIKQLEEAGDALYEGWIGYGFTNDKHLAEWRKAKEAKP